MATIEQKKKLIKTIKNPVRYFRLNFSRYGGEVAMGTITKDQYEYWSDNDGFEEYMGQVDYDAEEANREIPKRAQFDRPFYEYCLLYTSPSPRDQRGSRMPSSA